MSSGNDHDERSAANRQEFMRQVDPEHNPDYVMGPGDEVPRLATDEEREQLGLPARGAAPRRCVGEFRLADEEMTRRCEKPHGHRGDCGSKDAFRSKDSLSAARTRYAVDVVGLTAMTVALILNAISPDRIGLSILAFGAFCFALTALMRYRHA